MAIVEAMQGTAEQGGVGQDAQPAQAAQAGQPGQPGQPGQAQTLSREQLRDQIRDQIRRDVQTATRDGLSGRLTADEAARIAEQAAEQAADAAAQAAGRAITIRQAGQAPTIVQLPPTKDMIPREAVDISIGFFVMVVVCIVGLPIARAFARRMDRRGVPVATSHEVASQLQQLQQSVDSIAIEVERISEAQRYNARMLGEGAAQPIELRDAERVSAR